MTVKQYEEFKSRFGEFFDRNGVERMVVLSDPEEDDDDQTPAVTEFSKSPCECCGSHLFGYRNAAVIMYADDGTPDDRVDICVDCVFFNEYGKLENIES